MGLHRFVKFPPPKLQGTPRGLWPRKRVSERPTELQGSEGKPEVLTPYAGRHGWGGELALDKMHSGYTAFELLAPKILKLGRQREGRKNGNRNYACMADPQVCP